MVNLSDIVDVSNVACHVEVSSKKKALQLLAQMLSESINTPVEEDDESTADDATADEEINEMDILDALVSRERLGSTALGQGIAVPHGRIAALDHSVAAMITLTEGIEFDAPDEQPVDIIFALLVPEESTDEHLQILSDMAEKFSDSKITDALRKCGSEEQQIAFDSLCGDSPTPE